MMISRIWTNFLDTTPRQWGAKFANSFRPKSPKSSKWILASISIHASLCFSILVSQDDSQHINDSNAYQIEFQPISRSKGYEVEAVYDDTSDIIVRAPIRPKKKKMTEAERLVAKYRNLNMGSVANVDADKRTDKLNWKSTPTPYRSQTQTGKVELADHLDLNDRMDAKQQFIGSNKDLLNQYIAQHQSKFQSCYESALLKDESLNGKVHFELKTGPTGNIDRARVNFEGTGLLTTRTELQNCLQARIREIQFPSAMAAAQNRIMQFQAVLSL